MNDSESIHLLTRRVVELSLEVGKFLRNERRRFNPDKIDQKGFNNLVSYVDKEAESRIVNGLKEILPSAGIIAEEGSGSRAESGLNWIVDPLDGTTNYIHNIPFYCTSIALVEDQNPLLGVVYDPEHEECFTASTGRGAFLNENRISVSAEIISEKMLFATGFPYDDRGWLEGNLRMIGHLTRHTRGIRRLGSAALDMCYVACGRLDGFYELGLNAWDVAAATGIIREAGGVVDDFSGNGDPLFARSIISGSPSGYAFLESATASHFVL